MKTPMGNTVTDTQRRRQGEGAARGQRETLLPDAAPVDRRPGWKEGLIGGENGTPRCPHPPGGHLQDCLLETDRQRDALETGQAGRVTSTLSFSPRCPKAKLGLLLCGARLGHRPDKTPLPSLQALRSERQPTGISKCLFGAPFFTVLEANKTGRPLLPRCPSLSPLRSLEHYMAPASIGRVAGAVIVRLTAHSTRGE